MSNYRKAELRKSGLSPIKDLIQEMYETYRLEKKQQSVAVITKYPEIVGESIAKRTRHLYLKDKKLFLFLDSAPLRAELSKAKSRLIGKINATIGEVVVEDIVLK